MKKQLKTKPSPFSIRMLRPGKTVSHSPRPRSSRQIKAIDAVKRFRLDKMDMTFDPAMARHRCMGNFADPIPVLARTTCFERTIPKESLDEQTERFLEREFNRMFPTKTKKAHLPLLEQRNIAAREALGMPGIDKPKRKRGKAVLTRPKKPPAL